MCPDYDKRSVSSVFIVLSALVLFIAAAVFFTLQLFKGSEPPGDFASQPVIETAAFGHNRGRLLVIMIDSVPRDIVFSDRMPFINSMREHGAWGTSHVVSVPFSAAGDDAVFSGKIAGPLALMSDFSGKPVSHDNVFKRIADNGKNVLITGNPGCLAGMFGQWIDSGATLHDIVSDTPGTRFGNYMVTAEAGYAKAMADLKANPWDIAAVQLLGLDYVGHLETTGSDKYLALCTVIDSHVRDIVSLTGEYDHVLITSEHGMDENGFHTDMTPPVTETGFLLRGPGIQAVGPLDIRQIDLVSTLSIIAGVSPYYQSLTVPALEALALTVDEQRQYIDSFASILAGASGIDTVEELRRIQVGLIAPRIASGAVAGFAFLSFIVVVALVFSIMYVSSHDNRVLHTAGKAVLAVVVVISFGGVMLISGLVNIMSIHFPFSTNYIRAHFVGLTILAACFAAIALSLKRTAPLRRMHYSGLALIALSSLAGWIVLMADNPYNVLNWFLLLGTLFLWLGTGNRSWAALMAMFVAGLMIRRLTFYASQRSVYIPSREHLAIALFVLAASWEAMKTRKHRFCFMASSVLPLALFPLAFYCFDSVESRFVSLVLLVVIPAVYTYIRGRNAMYLWAVWTVFFYLGTSGSINQLTHVVALPLFLVPVSWSRTNDTSYSMLIYPGVVIWLLYVLPGNEFTMNLMELSDSFIIVSAETENILRTVAVIGGRYFLPAAVLFLLIGITSSTRIIEAVCVSSLPAILAISGKAVQLAKNGGAGSVWGRVHPVIVMIVYCAILVFAFTLSFAGAHVLKRRASV